MNQVVFTIDSMEVNADVGDTIMMAARKADIYIPYLCSHPGLDFESSVISSEAVFRGNDRITGEAGKVFDGCQLCLVKIDGREGTYRSCVTSAENGMSVHNDTTQLRQIRHTNFLKLLATHPNTCILCPQKEGCSISSCSFGVPEEERCCPKFWNCEIRKLVEYLGIEQITNSYVFRCLPVVRDEPLFVRDYNLCINCLRCVRACHEMGNADVMNFTIVGGKAVVGTLRPTIKESGCKFCGACVDICPTGALIEKDANQAWKKKVNVLPPVFPPGKWLLLNSEAIAAIPFVEGVYKLLDEKKQIIYIGGSMNLRSELENQLKNNNQAKFFVFEVDPMYTSRENELLQQFLHQYGKLPEQNINIDDLL